MAHETLQTSEVVLMPSLGSTAHFSRGRLALPLYPNQRTRSQSSRRGRVEPITDHVALFHDLISSQQDGLRNHQAEGLGRF
jgi:hypothetical protein